MEKAFVVLAAASLFAASPANTVLKNTCHADDRYQTIADYNAATMGTTWVAPFGRIEKGWEIYAWQVAETIGTDCAADTNGFAASLATWQYANRLSPSGVVDSATLQAMKQQ